MRIVSFFLELIYWLNTKLIEINSALKKSVLLLIILFLYTFKSEQSFSDVCCAYFGFTNQLQILLKFQLENDFYWFTECTRIFHIHFTLSFLSLFWRKWDFFFNSFNKEPSTNYVTCKGWLTCGKGFTVVGRVKALDRKGLIKCDLFCAWFLMIPLNYF